MSLHDLAASFAQPWAVHRRALAGFVAAVQDAAPQAAAAGEPPPPAPPYVVRDGIAMIPMRGVMLDSPPLWIKRAGIAHVDTRATARAVDAAAQDPTVTGLALLIDSPGGMVAGTEDLGNAVHRASVVKPVAARVDGMCCSAAYWVAAQATFIKAESSASEIGSIGVYTVLADVSRMYAAEGVDLHLVASGGIKGHGADGRVTQPLLAAEQKLIDGLAAQFRAAVARGRRRDLAHLATGETWLADEAVLLGLADQSPAHPEGAPMDLATIQKLVADHPTHAVTITSMAADGKDESAIRATIADATRAAEVADLKAKLATVESDQAAQAAKHAEVLAAKDAELAAAKAECDRLAKLASVAGGAGRDPGRGEALPVKRRSEMTRADRAAFLREHGKAAYDALPF